MYWLSNYRNNSKTSKDLVTLSFCLIIRSLLEKLVNYSRRIDDLRCSSRKSTKFFKDEKKFDVIGEEAKKLYYGATLRAKSYTRVEDVVWNNLSTKIGWKRAKRILGTIAIYAFMIILAIPSVILQLIQGCSLQPEIKFADPQVVNRP